jgi:chromosome partitioning protein
MTRTIAISNEKGGVGKTTTAVNLAHALAQRGHKVLLVDLDPQANATQHLGATHDKSAYHLLATSTPPAHCIANARPNLDVIISSKNLFAAELAIAAQPGRELILRQKLQPELGRYDFVIIDSAPSTSVLSFNALAACREILVPVSMDYLSLTGLESIQRTIGTLRQALNHDVRIAGIIPTLFHARIASSREILTAINQEWGAKVLPTIRTCSKLRDAPRQHQTIFEHAPESRGAHDYQALAEHVAQMEVTPP